MDPEQSTEYFGNAIGIPATTTVSKGDALPLNKVALYNVWIHTVEFTESNFASKIDVFIEHLVRCKGNISLLLSKYQRVDLNFFIRTNLSEFEFMLPIGVVTKLAELGIGVEVNLLSYGDVDRKETSMNER
jgi:hypothetical protein